MVYDSIEFTFDEVTPGNWTVKYRIIKDGIPIASNLVPGFWPSQNLARAAAERHAGDFSKRH